MFTGQSVIDHFDTDSAEGQVLDVSIVGSVAATLPREADFFLVSGNASRD